MKLKEFVITLLYRIKGFLNFGKVAMLICIPLALTAAAIGILTLGAESDDASKKNEESLTEGSESLSAESLTTQAVQNSLEYQSLGNGSCIVMGLGSFDGSELYIPDTSPSGDTVIGIGSGAFENCTALVSVSIPESVTSVGSSVFKGCSSLVHISVATANENYCSLGGVLYSEDRSVLICCPAARIGNNFLLDTGVKVIDDYAFFGNLNIVKILYQSSTADFESISIGEGNEQFLSLPITCNYVPSK